MKRKFLGMLTLLCLLAVMVLPTMAASPRLVDEAGLLSFDQKSELQGRLDQISNTHHVDVVIVTVESTNGQDPMDYADDFFDYGGYSADGILLLLSMEDRDWWISTTGYGITALTDAGIAYMGEQFVPYLSDGEYGEGFMAFADLCDAFLTQAKTGDPYDTHNLPKEPFRTVMNLVICVALGLVAAFLATGSMKKKLKSVQLQDSAADYLIPGSLQLTRSRDMHLYTHLDRREKAQSSSGSSTHTSSSGTTHGGGGGKF